MTEAAKLTSPAPPEPTRSSSGAPPSPAVRRNCFPTASPDRQRDPRGFGIELGLGPSVRHGIAPRVGIGGRWIIQIKPDAANVLARPRPRRQGCCPPWPDRAHARPRRCWPCNVHRGRRFIAVAVIGRVQGQLPRLDVGCRNAAASSGPSRPASLGSSSTRPSSAVLACVGHANVHPGQVRRCGMLPSPVTVIWRGTSCAMAGAASSKRALLQARV